MLPIDGFYASYVHIRRRKVHLLILRVHSWYRICLRICFRYCTDSERAVEYTRPVHLQERLGAAAGSRQNTAEVEDNGKSRANNAARRACHHMWVISSVISRNIKSRACAVFTGYPFLEPLNDVSKASCEHRARALT